MRRQGNATSFELRAAIALAQAHKGLDGGAAATAELARASDWFSEGRETRDLSVADVLLSSTRAEPG